MANRTNGNMSSPDKAMEATEYYVQMRGQIMLYKSLEEKYDAIEMENSKLKEELEEIKKDSVEKSQSMDTLRDQMEKMKFDEPKSTDSSTNGNRTKLEADLKIALVDLEAMTQKFRQGQAIQAQLAADNEILSAKLNEQKKISADQEEAWQKERTTFMEHREKTSKEIRSEMEGKVHQMMMEMERIYVKEARELKEQHKKQERDLTTYKHRCEMLTEESDAYVAQVRSISEQLYNLNEEYLELKKENEFLKDKLRPAENNPDEP